MTNKYIIAIIITIFLMSIGTLFDYQLTDVLAQQNSLITMITDVIGYSCPSFSVFVAFTLLYRSKQRERYQKKYLASFFYFAGSLIAILIFVLYPIKYFIDPTETSLFQQYLILPNLIAIIIGFLILLITMVILNSVKERHIEFYAKRAKFILYIVFLAVVSTQIIKTIWGRPRYWYINEGLADFQNWYQISGPTLNDGLRSFVSGHTSSALTILSLLVLTTNQKKINFYFCLIIFVGIFVGFGRMIAGQHFLTDITAGGFLTLTIFYFFNRYIENNKYHYNNN